MRVRALQLRITLPLNKWLLAELHLIQLIPPSIYTPVCNTICPHIELAKGQGKCRMRLKRVLPKGAKCARAMYLLKYIYLKEHNVIL